MDGFGRDSQLLNVHVNMTCTCVYSLGLRAERDAGTLAAQGALQGTERAHRRLRQGQAFGTRGRTCALDSLQLASSDTVSSDLQSEFVDIIRWTRSRPHWRAKRRKSPSSKSSSRSCVWRPPRRTRSCRSCASNRAHAPPAPPKPLSRYCTLIMLLCSCR